MKQNIAILTDSSSAIYRFNYDYKNIFMIDLPCFIGETIFTDFMKNKDELFYQALNKTDLIAKTSQPSVGETLEKYEYIKSLGYTDIIYLPISKELSGTYLNGNVSKEQVEGINVAVVDTRTTASVLGALAVEAARLAESGLSVEEIIKQVMALRDRSAYFVTVNDLTSLVKNGRLSNAKSIIAKMFRIKPVIHLNNEGKLVNIQTVRTYKKAIRELVNKVEERLNPVKGVIHLAYADNEEDLEILKSIVDERFPTSKKEVHCIPSTVVAHLGLSSIGLAYINY